ncbi:flagellin [Parageobacillus toebii]|uniref:flagellin N-terminal helical domain-containing protein n=1 Tax=Parageobacillus toebii TaxID=153151 RepID=UPI0035C73E5C
MRINHNIAALNTYRQLAFNNTQAAKNIEKLSSGLRINRAGDDAAGLAISEKMRGQIRGLEQASRNAQDAISLIQTAEGALNETHSILQRMRELAVQAANDTNTSTDRQAIQDEITQLVSEIDRIANTTEFNETKLLNGGLGSKLNTATSVSDMLTVSGVGDVKITGAKAGTYTLTFSAATTGFDVKLEIDSNTTQTIHVANSTGITALNFTDLGITVKGNPGGFDLSNVNNTAIEILSGAATFHIGANEGQNLQLGINDMGASALGVSGIDITVQSNANAAITTIQNAIQLVSSERSKLGAVQNRLEHTINNLGTSAENLTAAESRIRDVDMAKEMMEFTKNNILTQAAQAMLAQANQQPQGVLQLLR